LLPWLQAGPFPLKVSVWDSFRYPPVGLSLGWLDCVNQSFRNNGLASSDTCGLGLSGDEFYRASTYTSLSGVRKECAGFTAGDRCRSGGVVLWIGSHFIAKGV